MNRRNFIRSALSAAVGAGLLPAVPLDAPAAPMVDMTATQILEVQAIWPALIHDNFFQQSPMTRYFFARDRIFAIVDGHAHELTKTEPIIRRTSEAWVAAKTPRIVRRANS